MSDGINQERRDMAITLAGNLRTYLPGGAVRLGEAAVASTHPHRVNASRPGEVRVRTNVDAGQIYLAYAEQGRVVHLDVFHAPAEVPLETAAMACWMAAEEYYRLVTGLSTDVDCRSQYLVQKMYIRTAAGEGPAADIPRRSPGVPSGNLPQNHVHILLEIEPEDYGLLYFLVDHVEELLVKQEFQLRRVEKLVPLRSRRPGKWSLALPAKEKSWAANVPGTFQNQMRLKTVMDLSRLFGGPDNVLDFLSAFPPGHTTPMSRVRRRFGNSGDLTQEMVREGFMHRTVLGYALTEKGENIREYIRAFQRELEAQWRKILRRVNVSGEAGEEIRHTKPKGKYTPRSGGEKVVPLADNDWAWQVAVPETVTEAVKTRVLKGEPRLHFHLEDLKVIQPDQTIPMDICLLVDASASMSGRRIRSAAYLGEHLLLRTRSRVAVVLLQDRKVKVAVPFTRSYQRMREGLRNLETGGLTPLADGIVGSLQLIKRSRAKNPFLVLITDGLPTVAKWTGDPLQDALTASDEIGKSRVNFMCIGLQPDKDFLDELCRRAGGTLYVFEDLQAENMVRVFYQEQKHLLV